MKNIIIISDTQIEKAFEGTSFGEWDNNVILQRKGVAKGVMKLACGYANGRTMDCILMELGLITKKKRKPKKEGLRWMYRYYNK